MTTITLNSGATEADIQAAITSLKSGGTIILPANETIAIKSGLVIYAMSRDITLDLNGSTLQQAANVNVIYGSGANEVPKPVTLSHDADGHAVINYSTLPANIKPGDWVKIISDDTLPGDRLDDGKTPTRLGEAMQVLSVDGNKVTFDGDLNYADLYKTNVRASEIQSGQISIINGDIKGDQAAKYTQQLIQLRNTVDAHIEDVTIHDGSSRGIQLVNCVDALVKDVSVKNLINSGFLTGVAVQSLSSKGTTVDGLYAEKVTHATDNNGIGVNANSADPTLYGADINMKVVNSTAYNTTDFAWSWHSEGLNGTISHVTAVNSFGFLDARGIGNTLEDSMGIGNVRGIMFYEHGQDDSRGITIDSVMLKETQTYSVFVNLQPVGNTIIDSNMTSYQGNGTINPTAVTLVNTFIAKTSGPDAETITGTAKTDLLAGGKGADIINGGAGNDIIYGGAGADMITGSTGRDTFVFHDLSEAGDVIRDFTTGTNGDFIDISVLAARLNWPSDLALLVSEKYVSFEQSGNDTLLRIDVNGKGDNFVTLATFENVDARTILISQVLTRLSEAYTGVTATETSTMTTSVVQSLLPIPAPVFLTITGDANDNTLVTTETATTLEGLGGSDRLTGGDTADTLYGGDGADTLIGAGGTNLLFGGAGNDLALGGQGHDAYDGGTGIDQVSYGLSSTGIVLDLGTPANSTGFAEGDTFTSVESFVLTSFADRFTGDDSASVVQGGAGDDDISGGGGNDTLCGDAGNDRIDGGDGNDELRGGDGDDLLTGGAGADKFNGGAGIDTVSYAGATTRVSLAMDGTLLEAGNDASGDTFYGIEKIIGSAFDDVLIGDLRGNALDGGSGNDRLDGGAGIDTLHGGIGNDVIIGGAGQDLLWGDAGDDIFVFTGSTSYGDRIKDFESGHDHLQFSLADLGLDANATFDVVAGATPLATTAGPTFLLNTTTGVLTFDSNGSALGGVVTLGTLENVTHLGATDFLLV